MATAGDAVEPCAGKVEARSDALDGLFRAITEGSTAAVLVFSDDKIVYANRSASILTGISAAELRGIDFWAPFHPEHRDVVRYCGRALQDRLPAPTRYEVKVQRGDGLVRWVDITGCVLDLDGRPAAMITALDVTDARRAEGAAREAERRLRHLLETAQLIALELDPSGRAVYGNPYLLELLGCAEEELVGSRWFQSFVPPDQGERLERAYLGRMEEGTVEPCQEHDLLTSSGERRLVIWNSTLLRDAQGRAAGVVSLGTDVTEQRRAEAQHQRDAFYDSLTGLPNRDLFLDRVGRAMARVRRRPRSRFAVLLVDLDRFERVNDSLGHSHGNRLLVEVARSLAAAVRPGDTLARLGGDQFVVLVEDLEQASDALRVAERLQRCFSAPFGLVGQEVFATASIGVVLASGEDAHAEDLVRDAGIATYHARLQGPGRYSVFDASMHAEAMRLLQLEADLRRALERGELLVHYQPIVSLGDGKIAGFEALVRWRHPQRGLVPPADFIPVAEETGLILEVGLSVLETACGEAARWARDETVVSVNLSARQLAQPDLVERVRGVLGSTGLPARRLKLEMTESVLMKDPEGAIEILRGLKDLGVGLAIDDFGTGYSSLSYLLRLPFDTLKIDRSFVEPLATGGRYPDVVGSILALAQGLGMDVVAEGVETDAQRAALTHLRCASGQGYLFSRPVEAEVARGLMEGGSPRTALA